MGKYQRKQKYHRKPENRIVTIAQHYPSGLGGCLRNPPKFCPQHIEIDGIKYADLTLCEFVCEYECPSYNEVIKNRKK